MKRMSEVLIGLFLCCAIAATAVAEGDAVQKMRASVIRARVAELLNEKVRVEGIVTQYADSTTKTTNFFMLKDDWGGLIKVRTSMELPSVNKRYSIEGPVSIDPRKKEVYISEENRTELFKGVEPVVAINQSQQVSPPTTTAPPVRAETTGTATTSSAVTSTATVVPPIKPESNLTMYLLVGAAVIVILAAAVIMTMRSRSAATDTGDFTLAAARTVEPPPAPEQVVEGKTIKMHAPPPNTVKLLPGWFEVAAGDDTVKQIRLYNVGGDNGQETTFGRATGRPYVHIQLKAPTVSSRQAKVFFDAGKAKLTNLAPESSNPTRVNGRNMGVNESVPLRESDRVEMGEVSLVFHETQAALQTLV